MLNFILFTMEKFLLSKIKDNCLEQKSSHDLARKAIDTLEFSVLNISGTKFVSYSKLTEYQALLLKALDIPPRKNHKT